MRKQILSVDLVVVQEILRHSKITITQRYIQPIQQRKNKQ